MEIISIEVILLCMKASLRCNNFMVFMTFFDYTDAARNFKAVMAWWQEMAQQNNKCNSKETSSIPKRSFIFRGSNDTQKGNHP